MREGKFVDQHFNDNGDFKVISKKKNLDAIPTSDELQVIERQNLAQSWFLGDMIPPFCSEDMKHNEIVMEQVEQLTDLIEKCLKLDPSQRLKPKDALRHP